ncbi:MAG: glycosyltransferase [Longimicrobiales bacterium]
MAKIRLMHLTYDLSVSGLERVVVTICRTIDRERFEPFVLTMRGRGPLANELEAMGVTVLDIGQLEDAADYLAFWRVARELRRHRIDVLHTHNSLALFDGFVAARLSGIRSHVHTDHGRNFPDKRRYMMAERFTSYFVSQLVAVSDHSRANLIHYEKIAPGRILTIPNGVIANPATLTTRASDTRTQLGIGDGPVVGFIARLYEQKGAIYLLQALVKLRNMMPGVIVLMAGSGILEASLKQASVDLGVQDNVRFLGTRSDVPELLQVFDVFAIPSIWEGLPMSLLEALGWGCPVVATDVGGMSAVLKHRQNGSLVPPRDPDALANELAAVLSSPELRQRYREHGLRTFAQDYSAEIMTRRYEDLYLEAHGRHGRRARSAATRATDARREMVQLG